MSVGDKAFYRVFVRRKLKASLQVSCNTTDLTAAITAAALSLAYLDPVCAWAHLGPSECAACV